MSRTASSGWGRSPQETLETLRRREWSNATHLRGRLLGDRAFPIRLLLGAPTGGQAIADLKRFQAWMEAWRKFDHPEYVERSRRQFSRLGEQDLPVALMIPSMRALAAVLGDAALARLATWEARFESLLPLADSACRPALYAALVQRIERLEQLSPESVDLLVSVVPQLCAGLGEEAYLRALPLRGVDTKFVEIHELLITDMLDALHDGAVSAAGGLRDWLNCRVNPSGWLTLRPLDNRARKSLGDLPLLQLPMQHLAEHPLPASRILVVENLQSGLALPPLADTIAVIGTGRNLGWLAAPWLAERRIGYWGDVDSWGLQMLGEARLLCSHIEPLMIDCRTLEAHAERVVPEPESCRVNTARLTLEERSLHETLHADGRRWRLEQERLSADWIGEALAHWLED